MNDASAFFAADSAPTLACQCNHCTSGSNDGSAVAPPAAAAVDSAHPSSHLLSLSVQVTAAYIRIALQQFAGYVACYGRQVSLCRND